MAPPPDDDLDLDPARRQFVDDLYARREDLTHYEFLGVPKDADRKALSRAYFERSTLLHPDRYRGKRLGAYAAKMQELFFLLTESYDVLRDKAAREAYDVALGDTGSLRREIALPAQREERARAMVAMRERYERQRASVTSWVETAKQARAAGDLAGATSALEHAERLVPSDPTIKAFADQVRSEVAARLVDGYVQKALVAERMQQWEAAAETWKLVLAARPHDAAVAARLSQILARIPRH